MRQLNSIVVWLALQKKPAGTIKGKHLACYSNITVLANSIMLFV